MGTTPSRRRILVCGAAFGLMLAVALVFWPALRAYLEGDDFSLLAFARVLRDPLALFAHEHFPFAPYFRPMAMAVWWLSAQLFGNAIAPQYALNLLLHAAVSIALWRVLNAFSANARVSWVFALLFAIHPIGIGTALWLSDRFDLLATLFSLCAIHAALGARAVPTPRAFGRVFLWIAAALLSKEIAVVGLAVVCLLWAWPYAQEPFASRKYFALSMRRALVALALISSSWLLWRAVVMHHAAEAFPYAHYGTLQLLLQGGARWSTDFMRYLLAVERMQWLEMLLLGIGFLGLAIYCIAVRARTHASARVSTMQYVCAIMIILIPGAIQAPIAFTWPIDFAPATDPTAVAAYARLFYFSLCGVALIATLLVTDLLQRQPSPVARFSRATAALAVVLVATAWASSAHRLANDFRKKTHEKEPLIAAALATVERVQLPKQGCRLFLLNVDRTGPAYVLHSMADAVIKARAIDIRRVENCLIQTEQAPWATTLGGPHLDAAAMLPMRPMSEGEGSAAWLNVGGAEIAYLNLHDDVDARGLDGIFLRRSGEIFEDVSNAVHAGTLSVRFECARSPEQCR